MSKVSRSSIRVAAKNAVIRTHELPRDPNSVIQTIGADLMALGLQGGSFTHGDAEETATQIVTGAIEGAFEAGGDILMALRSIVHGTVCGAVMAGADGAEIAVAGTHAAARAARRIGIPVSQATGLAMRGAMDAGSEFGDELPDRIQKAWIQITPLCERLPPDMDDTQNIESQPDAH